ncbi:hypothetical protein Glove_151g177 [Diversispora epigaea]|uniref:Uncharacterized protein n=1 Tax=Diversispora epigaea TaxID=1348612 RepID=A0A397IXI8_9GLOM|nr:hypothetical protein Glove_151g177 [Diversispora epigaea]
MGVKLDENLANDGIYTFQMQGGIYYFIGSLLPTYGKLDIFVTITYNTWWSEITSELLPMQTPQDRSDLTELSDPVEQSRLYQPFNNNDHFFQLMEYQDFFNDTEFKTTCNDIKLLPMQTPQDRSDLTELSDPVEQSRLYQPFNNNVQCMREILYTQKKQKKGSDSYPLYHRGAKLDNRWAIPYNPYFSFKFDYHQC